MLFFTPVQTDLGAHPPFSKITGQMKCDSTRAETRFRLTAKRTSPFKSPRASVQSTAGSRGVRISGSNAGYTMFWGSVKSTGYLLHSPDSPSLPLLCVTVCHYISTGTKPKIKWPRFGDEQHRHLGSRFGLIEQQLYWPLCADGTNFKDSQITDIHVDNSNVKERNTH